MKPTGDVDARKPTGDVGLSSDASTTVERHVVGHPAGSYTYTVGSGILGSFRSLVDIDGPVVVVTEHRTADNFLPLIGPVDQVVVLPGKGRRKTLDAVQEVHRQLLDARMDRSVTVVSLGDSVVSDVAGFAAATYLRGVDVIHLPTELIAMIDTSVGGKVGLDVPHGRNLIGLFKQPSAIVADVATLQVLSDVEFASGMSEVVKHAVIEGGRLLETVEGGSWQSGDPTQVRSLVSEAVLVKIGVIEDDPFDEDRRQVLNLGHTFAYAFESTTFGELTHGQAVGLGLVTAARLSNALGLCAPDVPETIEHLIRSVGGTTQLPRPVEIDALHHTMGHDKKRRSGNQRFVLLEDIGRPVVRTVSDRSALDNVLRSIQPGGL